ncbi:MAG: DUF368 domain-containing protein [Ruminococcaceae bacterium]|nr:DUF368 domain-containing protein [Oscillospiraceae bacterium]
MKDLKKFSVAYFFIVFFEAMFIGIGGILPGISGGVLCVIFGFYKPLVDTLADPIHRLVPNLYIILPLALGSAAGFLCLARFVADFMEANSTLATCVFVGLIIGTIPDMWHDAGKTKRTKASWSALILTTVLFLSLFMYLKFGSKISIEPNIIWYFMCGVIWGISIVVPGLSSSSTLIFLGLYQPMVDGVSQLRLDVLLPILVGIVLTIILLSRFVKNLYERHHSVASHIIIGIVIATTVPIIPYDFASVGEGVLAVLCLAGGAGIAGAINVICPKLAAARGE